MAKPGIKIIVAIVAAVVLAGVVGFKMTADARAKKEVDAMVADAAGVATIKYDKVKTGLFNRGVTVTGLSVSPAGEDKPVQVGRVTVDGWNPANKTQLDLCMTAEQVSLPAERLPQELTASLENKKTLTGGMHFCYNFDPLQGSMDLSDLQVNIKEIGTLHFTLGLGNLDFGIDSKGKSKQEIADAVIQQMEQNPLAAMGVAMKMSLRGAELRYTDNNWLNRQFEYVAREQNTTAAELKNEAKKDLLKEIPGEDKLSQQAREAISRFIDTPSTIRISLAPKNPVPIMSLQQSSNPAELLERLNVTITN